MDCLYKLLHLCLPTHHLIHGGDLDRDKDISQHKCWVTHFQMADPLLLALSLVCYSVYSKLPHFTTSNLFISWIYIKAECSVSPAGPVYVMWSKTVWLINDHVIGFTCLSVFAVINQCLIFWLVIYGLCWKTNSQCACSYFHRELT